MSLPGLPDKVTNFISYLELSDGDVNKIIRPYLKFESKLREIYAQDPKNLAVEDGHINLVPIFKNKRRIPKIRGRHQSTCSSRYIMPLEEGERREIGAPAVVPSIQEFQDNFKDFLGGTLTGLNWHNMVVAGGATTLSLLPIPEGKERKEYYKDLAEESDVDIFLYGLSESYARRKMKEIQEIMEKNIGEVTTIRTTNAITIVSKYPVRHVQIILRIYDSISQILTGFDVDCACTAYNGEQVYCTPRAITALVTQCNNIDLSRRSPSYENRLFKYRTRNFEIYWALLDRSRVNDSKLGRYSHATPGLARLLIYERKTRELHWKKLYYKIIGYTQHLKQFGDVADGETDILSSYHTIRVPFGPDYGPKKIEDIFLKYDRKIQEQRLRDYQAENFVARPWTITFRLHKHLWFVGLIEDVLGDCCTRCPAPNTILEIESVKRNKRIYVSGRLEFIIEDPGRQEIGSFNPTTSKDWTENAYRYNRDDLEGNDTNEEDSDLEED